VIIYAESSAILAWLVGEPAGDRVRKALAGAETVVSSAVTAVECARGLSRARAGKRLTAAGELAALRLLDVAESSWNVHLITDEVLRRARARFPVEPVRTLDAIHLATAALFRDALGPITMLSWDERVRSNAEALGLDLL